MAAETVDPPDVGVLQPDGPGGRHPRELPSDRVEAHVPLVLKVRRGADVDGRAAGLVHHHLALATPLEQSPHHPDGLTPHPRAYHSCTTYSQKTNLTFNN